MSHGPHRESQVSRADHWAPVTVTVTVTGNLLNTKALTLVSRLLTLSQCSSRLSSLKFWAKCTERNVKDWSLLAEILRWFSQENPHWFLQEALALLRTALAQCWVGHWWFAIWKSPARARAMSHLRSLAHMTPEPFVVDLFEVRLSLKEECQESLYPSFPLSFFFYLDSDHGHKRFRAKKNWSFSFHFFLIGGLIFWDLRNRLSGRTGLHQRAPYQRIGASIANLTVGYFLFSRSRCAFTIIVNAPPFRSFQWISLPWTHRYRTMHAKRSILPDCLRHKLSTHIFKRQSDSWENF